jgi:hypothetical protein
MEYVLGVLQCVGLCKQSLFSFIVSLQICWFGNYLSLEKHPYLLSLFMLLVDLCFIASYQLPLSLLIVYLWTFKTQIASVTQVCIRLLIVGLLVRWGSYSLSRNVRWDSSLNGFELRLRDCRSNGIEWSSLVAEGSGSHFVGLWEWKVAGCISLIAVSIHELIYLNYNIQTSHYLNFHFFVKSFELNFH